ncbi:hypothetical protein DITRI_Ditri19aG0010000 [Diplodiscus trichospermus]
MDRVDRERRRRSFKERLGFRVMGCCGTTWGFGSTTMSVREDDEVEVEEQEQQQERIEGTNSSHYLDPGCVNPASVSSGMNLAAALAAERQFREAQEADGGNAGRSTRNGTGDVGNRTPGTPLRVSLMRLLEEADGGGVEEEEEEEKEGMETGSESMCCVCMGRKKGAAFIPCGHTFCRVCSRELWLNRGSCPICNCSILEILDIF